jgi:hypothetical protein
LLEKKQVFSAIDADGRFYADMIGLAKETAAPATSSIHRPPKSRRFVSAIRR